jgi:CheY-like chemotaxis protein
MTRHIYPTPHRRKRQNDDVRVLNAMNDKIFNVLIVDDSEVDRFFLRRAMQSVAPQLQIVGELDNGDRAIDYLSGKDKYADRGHHPFPDLLVLDSRMPGRGGIEVLEWLRPREFRGLKVAFFADSSAATLKPQALALGANFFFAKSVRSNELLRVARTLQMELERSNARKVLLRHRNTKAYYQGPCLWTPFFSEAMEFGSFEQAVHHAHDEDLTRDVEVMLAFTETGQMFSFPFPKSGQPEDA